MKGAFTTEKKWKNRITELLGIDLPIIQGGMIWTSGWELASAVSNAGGLGTIGAGSMYPEVLNSHIEKCKAQTQKPFAVNLPLLYPDIESHISTIINHEVPVVITSAGNPKTYTERLKSAGVIVGHVIANKKFARKAEEAGVDFLIAEGFEAGGHNGKEEITTLTLVPAITDSVSLPLIAAGGIWDSRTMLAAMILGAEGVQMGSRFVCSTEASCHTDFKNSVIKSDEGDTSLELKQLTPVRLLHNQFAQNIIEMQKNCATNEELESYLGRARAKKGMFEGDLVEGELEIGQNALHLQEILPAQEIINKIWRGFIQQTQDIASIS